MSKQLSRRAFLKATAVLTAGTVLAACRKEATSKPPAGATEAPKATPPPVGKKKLVFSSYTWSGYQAAMQTVIDKYVALNPNVEVEGQFVADGYWDKVQTQVAAGEGLDAGIADYGRVVSYAKNGTLLDITNYMMSSKFPIEKTFQAASSQYRWANGDFATGAAGGNYFGLPSDAQAQIMVYNKTMFDKAGVATPTDDWTWDDMLAAAKKLTKADENTWGVVAIDPYILFKGNWVKSAGGALHNPDFTKFTMTDPGTVEAYKWNWDLIFTHKVAPPAGALGSSNPFMTGKVGMYIEGVWWISDFVPGIKDFEWDVCLFPKHPKTGKRTTTVESDGWWVYKMTKEPEAAYNMIAFLGAEEQQKNVFQPSGYVIPSCYEEAAAQWYAQKPPENRAKVLENIKLDSVPVDYTYFEFGTISTAYGSVIQKAFNDGEDIVKIMQEVDKVCNEELNKAWELYKS